VPYIQPDIYEEPIRDTFRSFKEYVEDRYYKLYVRPGDTVTNGTATTGSGFGYVTLVEGVIDYAVATVCVPRFWINGKIKVTVYVAGDGTDTGNFYIQDRIEAVDSGIVLGSADELFNAYRSLAGAAGAGAVQTYNYTTTTAVDSDHVLLGYTIRRDATHGNDTNGDDLFFLGAVLEYQPTNRQ
jgi:hypothetical protein